MNRPTPDPGSSELTEVPQELTRRLFASCQFPSCEGLVGVRSGSQCNRKTKGLSMNLRVLPASCRQRDRRKALPASCRQHLGGAVSLVRSSWTRCMRKTTRGLSKNLDSPYRDRICRENFL